MTIKIDPNIAFLDPYNSQVEFLPSSSVMAASTIQQTSDAETSSAGCWESLAECFSSFITMIFNLISSICCRQPTFDELIEDPDAFLQKLKACARDHEPCVRNCNSETILYFLCKFEGDQMIAQHLGFVITSSMIQTALSKRNNDFNNLGEICHILCVVKSISTAEHFLKIPAFLSHIKKCKSFHAVVNNDNTDIARIFISHGAQLNLKNSDGKLPIHYIKSVEMAKIFQQKGVDFNVQTESGDTLLQLLTKEDAEKHRELIQYLKGLPGIALNNN